MATDTDHGDRVTVVSTTHGGTDASHAVASSAALLGYESASQAPPADLAVGFVDFPFTDESATFEDHLAVVEREQPRIAVAPDVEGDRDPADVYAQADRLAEHADVVVVVPKAIHPEDVPGRFRVGVPLANFGSDAPHTWNAYADVDELHLLGGSPTIQLEFGRYFRNVASLDGASVFKGAEMGNVWAPTRGRNWHPTGADQLDYYERVGHSLDNIVREWADLYGHPAPVDGDLFVPHDPDEYADAVDPELETVEMERAYRDAGARGAEPYIPEGDRDLWGPQDEHGMEYVDWQQRREDAIERGLAKLRAGMEQAGLDAWSSDARAATDGGDPATENDMSDDDSDTYDPTEEWRDDRPQQGTLGTEDPTQHRESRVDEGSDEFADDREQHGGADAGEQANLAPEEVGGGQQDLTGGDAEVAPEWDDEDLEADGGDDTVEIKALDPETGETDEVEAPREVNGWRYDPDAPAYRGAVVWADPADPEHYVAWEKTGGSTWLATYRGGADDENLSEATAEAGVDAAIRLMSRHDPDVRTDGGDLPGVSSTEDSATITEKIERRLGLHKGSAVEHPEHGTGTVTKVGPSGYYVDFTGDGESRRVDVDELTEADGDVYDPMKEWDPEAAAEEAEQRRQEFTNQMIEDLQRETQGTGLSTSDFTDWPSHHWPERDDPKEIAEHQEKMSEIYDPDEEEESTDTDDQADEIDPNEVLGGDPFDPTMLFTDEVSEQFETSVEWQDVERPERVPQDAKETEIDLAERILGAGGNRTGFSHHEDIRKSMMEWAPDRDEDHPDDPGYWRKMAFTMTPSERNMGRLEGDDEEQYKKARTVIAWASDTIDPDVLREIEQEQADDATDAWVGAAEDEASKKAAREFASDPPDTFNGWERYDPEGKPDVRVAYKGENHGTPAVAFAFGSGDDLDAQESVLDEFEAADSAAAAPMNRPISRVTGDTTVWEDLKGHLETFDVEPLGTDNDGQDDGQDDAETAADESPTETPDADSGQSGESDGDLLKSEHQKTQERHDNLYTRLRDMDVPGNGAKALAREYDTLDDVLDAPASEVYDVSGCGAKCMDALIGSKYDARSSTTIREFRNRDPDADDGDEPAKTDGFEVGDEVRHDDGRIGEIVDKSDVTLTVDYEDGGDSVVTSPGHVEQIDTIEIEADADDQDDDVEQRRGEKVEFARLDEANDFRDTVGDEGARLHPDDTRRTKTVTLHPDAPDEFVEDAKEAGLLSMADERKKYGQSKLSEGEREQLKRSRERWTWGSHGFEAMSAKAALEAEGAADWMNYYEVGEGVDGSLKNLEAAKERQQETGAPTAIRGERIDSDDDPGAAARAAEKGRGMGEQHARDACEHGEPLACDELLREYGWSEEEVERIKAAAEEIGEDPAEVYDPTTDLDTGQSFDEWAAENEPDAAVPSDEELAKLAPVDAPDELPGPALRALKKAWSGYKLSRQEHRQAEQRAEKYAAVINGIRAVNGQDPLTFDALDGWAGGEVMPDDPTEEFPAPEGEPETIAEAVKHGHASTAAQATFDRFNEATGGDPYDPTEDF